MNPFAYVAVPIVLVTLLIVALVVLGVRHMRKRKAEQRARIALEPPRGKPDARDLIPNHAEREFYEAKHQWELDHPGEKYPGTSNPKTTPTSTNKDTDTKSDEPKTPAPPAPKPGTKGTAIGGTPFRRE